MANITTKNNKIYSYIIILVSLFILVLFTKDQFTYIQISLDEKSMAETDLAIARARRAELNEIETRLNSGEINVTQYISEIREDDIIDYIYSQIDRDNLWSMDWIIVVRSLSLQEERVNELGFKELWVTLNLNVPNENRMFRMLDFFVGTNSKYKFFVDSFTYPNQVGLTNFNISIPLKVFYK